MVHQFVCSLLCLSIRGFYSLFLLVDTSQHFLSFSRFLSLLGIRCGVLYISMFQCCTMFVKVFGWNWFSWVWLQVGKFVHHIYSNTHTDTQNVVAFTFDCILCHCCCLRFLNALITDWSIVSVIFESIDQTYTVFSSLLAIFQDFFFVWKAKRRKLQHLNMKEKWRLE